MHYTPEPCSCPCHVSPRRIPFMLRSHLKKELDSMEKAGIIAKVTEPTNWVNALVVVKKPRTGKLRVCLDPRDLNKAIKRPLWPTLDDVTPKLAGAQFFSVLNAKSGYWAIKLTEELLKLTTFNTVVGRYKFLCLPFGLISAQDEFQRKTDETYERLNGVAAIVDNILVFGKTEEEHDANLRAMLMRTREKGVRLNPEKSVMCVPEVDTSKSGLGTVLLQDSKPVANASKSLTPTEENYGQIEKELYAVVFGCKRFHMYVYGRKVVVEFDHKPLEPILRKPLAATPPHLQRIILQLQRYDIQKYCTSRKPGKDIPIADALSSKSIPYKLQSLDEDMDAQIHTVVTNHPVSDRKLSDIRTATEQDPQLISLRSIVKSEWPDAKKKNALPTLLNIGITEMKFRDGKTVVQR
ncbi:crumbs -like protein [Labeo rohita]|uniref:ribonuclease H n=1 Tax=Labeo rohita TaxID=84645 RepID=A0A498L9G1_LABRO|nr:crumbs -like protein [Labeo rohita]